ncbi:hypothetical protein [Allosphingosinicella sp.]|uniref:hypothetical protein n=1 Tax=Allosphingosinicella sp. TaxID=2823234 RepID=UPI003D72B24F
MRKFLLICAAAACAAPAATLHAQGRDRDQDAAFRATQQGQILPLTAIRSRVQVPGADYIGAEFDPRAGVYRLKFMRGGDVIWVDVDARTGRQIGRSGN